MFPSYVFLRRQMSNHQERGAWRDRITVAERRARQERWLAWWLAEVATAEQREAVMAALPRR